MKKIKLLLLTLFFPVLLFSQGAEIVPFTGYMFGGSINFYEGNMNINDGQNYGLSVFIPVKPHVDLELNYTRMGSEISFSPYPGNPLLTYQESFMQTNYFQIGMLSKFGSSGGKAIPFGSFSLGATWFDSSNFGDVWMFSITLGAGVKIMFAERIGLVLRGRLMMPMQFAGIGFYAGTGGSGLSANSYVSPLQGDFNIGLLFKLGK